MVSTCTCDRFNSLFITGDLCEILDCPGEPDCSNRGSCIRKGDQSVCLCNPGFTGEDCSELVCPGEPACNTRGNGVTYQKGWPIIKLGVCDQIFAGDDFRYLSVPSDLVALVQGLG